VIAIESSCLALLAGRREKEGGGQSARERERERAASRGGCRRAAASTALIRGPSLHPPPPLCCRELGELSRADVIAMLVDNIIDLYNYVECIFEERFACSPSSTAKENREARRSARARTCARRRGETRRVSSDDDERGRSRFAAAIRGAFRASRVHARVYVHARGCCTRECINTRRINHNTRVYEQPARRYRVASR